MNKDKKHIFVICCGHIGSFAKRNTIPILQIVVFVAAFGFGLYLLPQTAKRLANGNIKQGLTDGGLVLLSICIVCFIVRIIPDKHKEKKERKKIDPEVFENIMKVLGFFAALLVLLYLLSLVTAKIGL